MTPATSRITRTLTTGEPPGPAGMETSGEDPPPLPRLPFCFAIPSRLIRIIALQNSLEPTQQQQPVGLRSARSTPHLRHLPPEQSVETDSKCPPATKTPDAVPLPGQEPWKNLRPDKSFQCALPPRWRGRSQTSSEFPAR